MSMVGQFTGTYRAAGNVTPFSFVAIDDTGVDNKVRIAGANDDQIVGVTQGSNKAFDSANHAESGDQVDLQPGKIVRVILGGTVDAGDRVKSDASGHAVVVATTGTTLQYSYGKVTQDGTSGLIVELEIEPMVIRPALS